MIELKNVSKSHYLNSPADDGGIIVPALKNISLKINQGEFVAIMGPSGSGKSTLLNILGCLDVVDKGSYRLLGKRVDSFTDDQLAYMRLRQLGFVFQSYNLISRIDAVRNVELPMIYANVQPRQRLKRAHQALNMVGLGDRAHHIPSQLSGGQQQRVAIARAIINNPKLIIADEPTGNLDTSSSTEIMNLFRNLNANGRTIVFVTHENEIAKYATRRLIVKDGKIVADQKKH